MKKYTIVLTKEDDGRYSVTVPSLPGCHTWGDSVDEATAMAHEAIALYLEELRSHSQAAPEDTAIVSSVEVA